MRDFIDECKVGFAIIGGFLGWVFGGFDSLIYALIAFVALDYITGVLLAIHDKKISSEIGFRGICKKAMIFVLVAVGHILDQSIMGTGSSIRTMLIMFYLSNEGISILENSGATGLPLPQKLKDILQQLNGNKKD
ncbi:MAG TPA: holin [Firmicutes bacterium]|jgi:toxin secretion/phage lysis holin|nr:holin [Bacillota bacterium]